MDNDSETNAPLATFLAFSASESGAERFLDDGSDDDGDGGMRVIN